MKRNETIAFGGNVAMLTEKALEMIKKIDQTSVAFPDDATAASKQIKSELESAGFRWWSFET